MRCCMGQIAKQCGSEDDLLIDEQFLLFAQFSHPFFMYGRKRMAEKTWVGEAYRINDDRRYSDSERESQLIALAAQNGIELKFTGSGPTTTLDRMEPDREGDVAK